ncbi:hypothetical protein GCM10009647_031670 [Streptomyces sanglieri]
MRFVLPWNAMVRLPSVVIRPWGLRTVGQLISGRFWGAGAGVGDFTLGARKAPQSAVESSLVESVYVLGDSTESSEMIPTTKGLGSADRNGAARAGGH